MSKKHVCGAWEKGNLCGNRPVPTMTVCVYHADPSSVRIALERLARERDELLEERKALRKEREDLRIALKAFGGLP